MFSAGESSGDQHAASLFVELKKKHQNVTGIGMGGTKMHEVGIDVRYDSSAIAVIGVIEVIKHYREIRRMLMAMKKLLASERPDLLICVDYKEFNFKLATYAKQLGIKVLFYVSPQVWAWRAGRVKQYGKVIDMMAVIFPFETAYYEAEKVPVCYVGHPSIDKVKPIYSQADDCRRYGLDPSKPRVGLLPGSRANEIKRLLPVMLAAAEILQEQIPTVQLILPQASSIKDEFLNSFLKQTRVKVKVIKNEPYDVIQCCDAVMTSSGTATLEIALLVVPMLITYKLATITYWLGRCLVKTPYIGLPNIIAGRSIVKEFIQNQATAELLATEMLLLLNDSSYAEAMREELTQVKQKLGQGGASKRMAELVITLLS